MQIDQFNMQQTAGVSSVKPVSQPSPASPSARESFGASVFGPAYVRETGQERGESLPLYAADGTIRNPESSSEAELADARAVASLEQRDRQVRQKEEAKGEAVGSRNYIYQTGPDGQRYAIGTAAHVVKQDENAGGASASGALATAPAVAPATAPAVATGGKEMSESDEALLDRLEARDAKVRGHEAAHVAAAGGQAGMPSYTYQTGPDGRRYAIGGSVNISMVSTGDSEQNARQAHKAYRSAMATGEPSAADLQAASKAMAQAAEAKRMAQPEATHDMENINGVWQRAEPEAEPYDGVRAAV